MRKKLLVLILMLISATSFAQTLECTSGYVYEQAQALDGNGEVLETFNNVYGAILFYKKGSQTAIVSTVGEQNMYILEVTSKKSYNDHNVYLGPMQYHGQTVMIEVFEIFDLNKSKVIPDCFIFFVRDNKTGDRVNGQAYLNISRKI